MIDMPIHREKSPSVNAAVQDAHRLTDWIVGYHPNRFVETGHLRVALACYSIALDHREAILLLLKAGARTSAYALARSVYEAFMRGLWCETVMTANQYEIVIERQSFPKFETMVAALKRHHENTEVFAQGKRHVWDAFSDYSHGGYRQVVRWLGGPGIEPCHPDDETIEILRVVNIYGFLSSMHSAGIAGLDITPYAIKSQEVLNDWSFGREVQP
jgi:hypothetical protein